MKKILKAFNKIAASMLLVLFLCIEVNAQTQGTGTLSINPSSVSFSAQGEKKTLNVIYTGNDMIGAEVYLTLGSGIKINSFTVGQNLTPLYTSLANNEIHVGSLENKITSGQTLFTFEVEATSCNETGQIGFNTSNTVVPDITTTFNSAQYTITCDTTPIITPTPILTPTDTIIISTNTPITTPYTPRTLPKTDSPVHSTFFMTGAFTLIVTGIITAIGLSRIKTHSNPEDVKLVILK